uniref:Prepilin leader peptidase/N-methyltransferase n=1 Tax=Cyanothece sp. (strain PCC 7425 / ATCC 29141) TaxID=395961 RepID=B8HYD1_CYAP4
MSLLYPPSRCPHCFKTLKPYENLPIVGWLALRGRCSRCRSKISYRYPLVEAVTAGLFLIIFGQFGWTWQTPAYWLFFSWLLALSLIDLDTFTLPHALTSSGVIMGLVVQVWFGLVSADPFSTTLSLLLQSILGAVLGLWLFDLIRILGLLALGQEAMGGGDSKLVAMIGAWLGWKLMLLAAFLGCAIGAFMGGAAIALGLLSRRQPIPFGPFLALGGAIATLYGEPILKAYLSWLGLAP